MSPDGVGGPEVAGSGGEERRRDADRLAAQARVDEAERVLQAEGMSAETGTPDGDDLDASERQRHSPAAGDLIHRERADGSDE